MKEPKTLADYFYDWESHVFGFGYGTGEQHTVPAVQRFLVLCPQHGTYEYRALEEALGPLPAWLLINALCRAGILEYGSSPRFGWLTEQGRLLRDFVADKTAEQLIHMTDRDEHYVTCMPTACNCGPNGYEEGRRCANPFW